MSLGLLRGIERLLREDRERLRGMQKSQPCFTGEQQRELVEVYPWMRSGGLPKVMDVNVSSLFLFTALSLYCFHF